MDRREDVRSRLLERARTDARIAGAAITGSGAGDRGDRWSDIDLFFGLADGVAVAEAVSDWSGFVYEELGALHHFELHAGSAIYRAFLLGGMLEVDLGFSPIDEFRPLGDGDFKVVFGHARARQRRTTDAEHLIGLAWHHVRHARVCIERNAVWQAEYWISAARDQILTLACLRLGYATSYGKGFDDLPTDILHPAEDPLVHKLNVDELFRALQVVTRVLLRELRATNADVAARLERPLLDMALLA